MTIDGARAEALVAPLDDSRRHEAAVGSSNGERNIYVFLRPELIDVVTCWHCRRQIKQEFYNFIQMEHSATCFNVSTVIQQIGRFNKIAIEGTPQFNT